MLLNYIKTNTLPQSQQPLISGSGIFITSCLHSNLSLVYTQFTSSLRAAGLYQWKVRYEICWSTQDWKTIHRHKKPFSVSPGSLRVWSVQNWNASRTLGVTLFIQWIYVLSEKPLLEEESWNPANAPLFFHWQYQAYSFLIGRLTI